MPGPTVTVCHDRTTATLKTHSFTECRTSCFRLCITHNLFPQHNDL